MGGMAGPADGGTIAWARDLAAVVGEHGGRVAVCDGRDSLTFAAMAARAASLAAMLHQSGVRHGQPVASVMRNTIDAVWVSVGLRIAGVAETPLNAGFAEAEKEYCIALSGARHVVTTADQAPLFRRLGCAVSVVEDVPPSGAELGALANVPADAWGRILFTSGTTGRPKAIVYTHAARWIGSILQRAVFETMPGPGSAVLLMTPFVHGAGLLAQGFHDRGAAIRLLDGVDMPRVRDALDHGLVDHIFAPPTPLAKIIGEYGDRRIDGIRTIFCGTAPLLPSLYAKARAMFGPVVRITYGKTEIINPITVLSPAATDAYYAEPADGEGVCVGWPATGVEVRIRDETGAEQPAGTVGEVFLRGRHMYHGHIDAAGFHPPPTDGFHDTGDLGRLDGRGRLHLVGRLADVIKSGGYKIYPDEIERVLTGTAGTGAVAVVSLASEYWGEIIVAVAETGDAAWPDRARAALGGIARYKHPRALLMMADLPRNAQGKILRRAIRDLVTADWRVVDGPYPTLERR